MNDKIKDAQSYISDRDVADMQVRFYRKFRGIYGPQTSLFGVGPLQSFLGQMIKEGKIKYVGGANGS